MRTWMTKASALAMSAAMLMTATPVMAVSRNAGPENPVVAGYTGWYQVAGTEKLFYFENGRPLANTWATLESPTGNGGTYQYYFNADGTLCTDLFKKNYKKWINKDILVVVNVPNHNLTFYARGKGKNLKKRAKKYVRSDYNIPLKTVVCSTSRKKNGTKFGKWAYLEKTSATRWYIYKKSHPFHYYQWGVHVKHANFWFHSSMYRTTNNRKLKVGIYNKLGSNQTTHCVRMQAVNAKLMYDIATKTNKKRRVFVKGTHNPAQASNYGPFGLYKLNGKNKIIVDYQGQNYKIKKKSYDPTDPGIKSNKKIY
ncbi:MAG: hypothetical protein U0K57_09730 [Lachnospiraceae bacterium]|nr:hypothetical protein [Lachnospiraceae bacterium]